MHQVDPATQILYNRTMVQLGLCAFRHGHIKEAHHALLDIQSSGRAKELLAQGLLLQRQHERTSEQEKIEKQRQMPFHMHINLELLECVYLVSAMLIEIPYMAAHESDARRRMISKSFHHQLKVSERQAVTGPPESMREHVVAASKAMRNGLWLNCNNYIINEKMNAKVHTITIYLTKVELIIILFCSEGVGPVLPSGPSAHYACPQDSGRVFTHLPVHSFICVRFHLDDYSGRYVPT